MKQSQTTIKELSAMYSAVLKRGILCNAIALGLVAAPAMAETAVATIYHSPTGMVNATNFDSFDAALAASEDWSHGKGVVVQSGSNFTYDFGGQTYSGYTDPAGSSGTRNQVFQLLKNSDITLKNGTINIADDATTGFWMGIQNYSDLTLENMTIDGSNLSVPGSYALSNNQGTVNITNSTIIAKAGEVAFDLWYWVPYYTDGVYVNLEDSTVSGKIEIGAPGSAAAENILTHAVLSMNGDNTITGTIENNGGTINVVSGNNTINGTIENNAGAVNVSGGNTVITENIVNNGGAVNLNGDLDLNADIIGASGSVATNHVNVSGTGVVNLTGAINNQTIAVTNGTELWLSDGAADGSNLAGSVMTVNGTINTIDNIINDYSGAITLNDGANIKGDVNFLDGVADMYAAGSGSTVNYMVGNLIGNVGKGSKTIQVVSDGATVDISAAQFNSENGATFESTSAADGSMIVRGFDGGVGSAADTSATVQNIQYQLTEDEQLTADKQIQNNFVLNGAGIDDADQGLELADANLTIADGAIVEINDLKLAGNGTLHNVETGVLYINNSDVNVALNNAGTMYSDPTTYSATVTNTGTASFDGDTFTATAVLANNGVANMTNDVTFESDATITGSGVTNLVNGTTHFNNTASGNTVKLASGADFDGALVGGNLNTQNKAIDNVSGTVSGADLYVDAELASVSGDIDRFADASTSVVKNINIVSNEYGSQGSYTLNLSGAALADDLTFSGNMNYYTDVTQNGDDVVFSNKLVNASGMHGQLGDWNAGNYIAGSNGYDSTTNSYVDADATHTVGAALTALDTQAKTNADAILTLNGGVDTAGSVANTVKNTAADADYDNTVSGLTATTIQGAIDENTVAINGNTAAIATLNNAMAANNALTLNQSVAYTDQRIEKLDKDLSSGIASAIALTSVAASGVQKGEVAVSGGYGYYNGQSAAAFGAAMGLSKRWSVNAGAGVSSSDVSFRAGTTYRFKAF